MELVCVGQNQRIPLKDPASLRCCWCECVAGDVERCRHNVVDRDRTAFGLLLPSHGEEGEHDARASLGSRCES